MALIFAALGVGFLAAKLGKTRKRWQEFLGKISQASLFVLLFSQGLALGSNSKLMTALPNLGLKSLVLALGIVGGSVLLTWLCVKIGDF